MKLILQHAGQSVEHEFVTQTGVPLTNQQAMAAIGLVYAVWSAEMDNPPANPTFTDKAGFIVRVLARRMIHAAKERRRAELTAANETQITTELG